MEDRSRRPPAWGLPVASGSGDGAGPGALSLAACSSTGTVRHRLSAQIAGEDHSHTSFERLINASPRSTEEHGETTVLTAEQQEELLGCMREATLFKYCSDESLRKVSKHMQRLEFERGEVLMEQGEPQSKVFLIARGSVSRLRYVNDQLHQVETVASQEQHRGMFGALHVLREEPTYATALTETKGVAYTLTSKALNQLLEQDPALSKEILYSLSKEVFRMSKLRTPLLEQDPRPNSIVATSVGATIESYYRSGLNAWLIAQLTGKPPGSMFPNFHIQIPTRVFYINGFKSVRAWLTEHVNPVDYEYPDLARLGSALVPGIAMSPVSSILEACNADHMNPEPLWRRCTRGLVPRCAREVIFGVGINQLSDACEERVAGIDNSFLRTAAGSIMAGTIAGYLSHVPHNMSTLKLVQPHRSYLDIVGEMVESNVKRTPKDWVPGARRLGASLLTFLLPRGCLIRTAQICGSFMIINGTINVMTSDMEKPLNVDLPKGHLNSAAAR
ncbi:unnamed protein product [Phaeothamnion confervicola]